jgi:hypothetical protein
MNGALARRGGESLCCDVRPSQLGEQFYVSNSALWRFEDPNVVWVTGLERLQLFLVGSEVPDLAAFQIIIHILPVVQNVHQTFFGDSKRCQWYAEVSF